MLRFNFLLVFVFLKLGFFIFFLAVLSALVAASLSFTVTLVKISDFILCLFVWFLFLGRAFSNSIRVSSKNKNIVKVTRISRNVAATDNILNVKTIEKTTYLMVKSIVIVLSITVAIAKSGKF